MMETATLQPPKSGRSRFSKALPAPPSLPAFDFESTEGVKSQLDLPQLPQVPQISQKGLPILQSDTRLGPLPPPKQSSDRVGDGESAMATAAKPLNSPLPPLPSKFAAPPPMSIPRRRPVPSSASVPVPTPSPAPAPAPASAPAPISIPTLAPPEGTPSPGGSFSSLLSAYSNHSADSTPQSSTNSTNDIVSPKEYTVLFSTLDAQNDNGKYKAYTPPALSDQTHNAQEHDANATQTLEAHSEELPPPPPLKDPQRGFGRPQTPTGLRTQTALPPPPVQTASPVGNASPQEQLWRRRSLKADKNIAVPELKLVSSHGSTAASAQDLSQRDLGAPPPQSTTPPPGQPQASVPNPPTEAPPRGANTGLPGRNIRPVVSSEQPASRSEPPSMGQAASCIKERFESRKHVVGGDATASGREAQALDASATSNAAASLPVVSPLSPPRLPSPENGTNDVKRPGPDTVVSPLSPAALSEMPADSVSAVANNTAGAPQAQIRHAQSSPALAQGPTNPGLAVRAPIGLPTSPAPNRERGGDVAAAPVRASPKGSNDVQAVYAGTRRGSAGTAEMQSLNWNPKPISETGSIETVKPMFRRPDIFVPIEELPLKEPDPNQPDTTDNPGAARFPRNWYTPLPPDQILDARPLEEKHFRCLTNHRYMTRSRQRTNPIACRTCGHKDRYAECFICSACHLNVCPGCNELLRGSKGDLGRVLGQIKEKQAAGPARPHAADESATASILEE